MANPTNKPYVRYQIEADVEARGVAFNVKQAIGTFMNSHGYAHRIVGFDGSSDSFRAVLELIDNGKCDFNMNALHEHLKNSGRFPTNVKKRPKVSFTPIPCDQEISVTQPTQDYNAFQKVIEGLQEDLAQREETIGGLTASLGERQRALDERTKALVAIREQNKGLEEKLAGTAPKTFGSPVQAVITGYVSKSIDSIFYASVDLVALGQDVQLFATQGAKLDTYTKYVNAKLKTEFKDDAELNNWLVTVEKTKDWTELPEVREIQGKKAKFEADVKALELIQGMQVSPELLETMKKTVEQSRERSTSLDLDIANIQKRIASDKLIYDQVKKLDYTHFSEVTHNSTERAKSGAELPLVVNLIPNGLTVYIPAVEQNGALENYVKSRVFSMFPKVEFTEKPIEGSIIQLEAVLQEPVLTNMRNRVLQGADISNDGLLNALGIKPKVIVIA